MVAEKEQGAKTQQEPIAVIGMSCIFPQAPDVKTFWQNILNGVNAVGNPLPTWEADRYLSSGRINTAKGGYLKDLYRFNPGEFGIMPNSLDGGEPDQLLALQVAKRALEDAGTHYLKDDYNHHDTGIVLGHSTYLHRGQINAAQHNICLDQTLEILQALMPEMTAEQSTQVYQVLKNQLPAFNADICPSEVPNVMTGRIANRLNFSGPNYLIDAACASSLLAINAAIEELRRGTSRMMLAGGVNASLPAEVSVIFTMLNALSNRGKVRPFDADSDGTLLGEGLGIVVLKRLSDALEDGDRIYAVVHGVGQSSDGKGLGLLAPSEKGETLAIQRAYDATGIDPATIGLIEAHGTGIVLGDKTEIASLKNILGARIGEQGNVAMGSVKSMISHCIPAAGMASFIKMCLSLHHKILPPTLCDNVNPELGIEDTPLYINNTIKPWISHADKPCRAGINSFGFGGVNAHAILEEAPAQANRPLKYSPWSAEICVFAANDRDGLIAQLRQLGTFLQYRDDCIILNIAYSLAEKAKAHQGPYRLALVAKDNAELAAKIEQAIKRLEKDDKPLIGKGGIAFTNRPVEGKLAFMFPGEGSQYIGMLEDLATHFDVVREWFDMWHGIYESTPGANRTDIIFPPYSELTPERRKELHQRLHGMDVGSEAVFIAGQAMNALLTSLGVVPDVMVGHSSGESSALVASRAIEWETLPQLGDFIRQLNDISKKISDQGDIETGALMAVALLSKEKIKECIKNTTIVIAMENCPNQMIVYGDKASVAKLYDVLVEEGAICEILPFDRGYHTPSFAPMQKGFAQYYNDIGLGIPKVPLYSCASAGLFPAKKTAVRQLAAEQWATTVRFVDTVMAMVVDGTRYFIEVGPSGKLASFVDQILRAEGNKECIVAASNLDAQSGLHLLLNLMAKLYVNDKAQVSPLFANRDVQLLDFDNLQKTKPKGVFLDNTMPRLHATPDLVELLQSIKRPTIQAQPVTPAPTTRQDLFPEYRPFFTQITEVSDTAFTGYSRLSVHEDRFMQHHVLSGAVSDVDPTLVGLSCVPLMVTIEIMAEACVMLAGSLDLTAIEEVNTFDWIALDKGEVTLEVRAFAMAGRPHCYSAEVFNEGSKVMSARFLFASESRISEPLPALNYSPIPFRWPDEYELYRVGMFHGPIFQTIPHVDSWSEQGIDATLSSVSLNGFFRDGETPKMVLNPVLLDAISQLPAFWVAQQLGTDFHTFPSKIERIEFYVQCPHDLDNLTLRTRQKPSNNASEGYEAQCWNFECVDADGQVLLRVKNLHKVFFEVSSAFYQCRHDPLTGWLGNPIASSKSTGQSVEWYLPYLDAEFCSRSNAIFLRTLAQCMLNAEERDQWHALKATVADKCQWLFRRICIKEAVRYFIYEACGELLYPSDISVEFDCQGVPYVGGWWCDEASYMIDAPEVSLQDGQREVFVVVSQRDASHLAPRVAAN